MLNRSPEQSTTTTTTTKPAAAGAPGGQTGQHQPVIAPTLLRFRKWRQMRRRLLIQELQEIEDGMIEDGELHERTIGRRAR